jgi:uncharacterized lipoprotein YajG
MKNLALLGAVFLFASCSTEAEVMNPVEESTSMMSTAETLPVAEVAQAEVSALKKIDLEISGMR